MDPSTAARRPAAQLAARLQSVALPLLLLLLLLLSLAASAAAQTVKLGQPDLANEVEGDPQQPPPDAAKKAAVDPRLQQAQEAPTGTAKKAAKDVAGQAQQGPSDAAKIRRWALARPLEPRRHRRPAKRSAWLPSCKVRAPAGCTMQPASSAASVGSMSLGRCACQWPCPRNNARLALVSRLLRAVGAGIPVERVVQALTGRGPCQRDAAACHARPFAAAWGVRRGARLPGR